MQKKSIRRILNIQCNEHKNNNFIELNALKLFDLLKYKTGLSICKANKNLRQKMFTFFFDMAMCTLEKPEISNSLM